MKTRINDLREEDAATPIGADVCIIGSGPAGLTIAAELAGCPFSVLVIESGARGKESDFAASLNEIENVGAKRILDQRRVRNRAWGGSSLTWSGRCRPFDRIDFETRPWIHESGWPIRAHEIEPFLRRSAPYLGLTVMEAEKEFSGSFPAREESFPTGDELELISWQFSRSSSFNEDYARFGPRFSHVKAANIRSLTNATVTEIVTSEDGSHATGLTLKTPDGKCVKVKCRFVILCAGGIENARLLLASNRQDPRGVGNAHDVVGRYLMDHARATLGTFDAASQKQVLSYFGVTRHPSGAILQRGLSLRPEIQRKLRLVNGAAWMTQHVEDDDVWRALRSLARRNGMSRATMMRNVLRNADQIVGGIWNILRGRDLPRRMGRLDLDTMIEQEPNPDSRILLSDRKDALGMPLARIDWRIGEKERWTAIRLGHAVNAALQQAGMPTATLAEWVANRRVEDADFLDQAHPTGSTRMSANPRTGVVDCNCKVHGIDNLYIAGSSVFPTAGHANPTLMIVALALRLADRVRQLAHSAETVHTISTEVPVADYSATDHVLAAS